MELIPVVDLMGGVVVHARRGDRAQYRPIASGLCAGAAPTDIADALQRLAPFRTLYIADLDAIADRPAHDATIGELTGIFPELWVDAGRAVEALPASGGVRPVVGTETLRDAAHGFCLLQRAGAVLSLDHGPEGARGPTLLHERSDLWPRDIIVMTLARVGSDEGPDLARLRGIIAMAGGRRVHAAGGVRNVNDLHALRDIGVAGVLLASALHNGRLAGRDLRAFTA